MSSARIRTVLALFRDACELPMEARVAYLAEACGDDTELRAEVESMLAWDEADACGDDAAPAAHPVRAALSGFVDTARPDPAPARIGGYRIVRLIAHGGMGAVYEAAQEHPARRVAVKLAHAGGASAERQQRFELEAQLLARLRHPGIAQIIEAGTSGPELGGRPFFAMEFVEGRPLQQYASAHQLSTRQRLELVVRVCAPVAFAHRHGVIHRDLKPDNILVDEHGDPKVLDFGVAKVEAAGGFGAATLRTEAGRVIGTIGYMAPEQLGGESEKLTPAADVYSLGVLIYELLTARLPHELDGVTLSRALAVVTSTDAPLLGVVRPEHRGDIEAVVAKALEKHPRDRYQDAGALCADLERVLREEPVVARRHSALHRLRKFSRRNRGLVGGVAATMLALLAGLAVTLVFATAEAAQRGRFDQLAAVVLHERLIEAESRLWPAWPENAVAMQAWLADCDRLLGMREQLAGTARELSDEGSRDDAQQFLLTQLTRLLDGMDRLAADLRPSLARRHRWASEVADLTRAHPGARVSWATARAAVANSAKYAGQGIELADADVTGLVPIGENPVSGLWEFYDLRSAWDGTTDPASIAIPEHRHDGSIAVGEATGIVFVLVPGCRFWMGAQKENELAQNFDPRATQFEKPVHEVELGAYMLAKHELTQGQWARLTGGERPSFHHDAPDSDVPNKHGDDRHPVEQVNWYTCRDVLAKHAMLLPTEAQWEYACRAGTSTPWSTGKHAESLAGFANVLDQTAVRERPVWSNGEPFDDGYQGTAPVGTYAANAFGLHDMHGNVFEWVAEPGPAPYANNPPRAGDGMRPTVGGAAPLIRFARGGALDNPAHLARSARRQDGPAGMEVYSLGVRPARALHVER